MFEAKGLGELLIFVRGILWAVVCKAEKRNPVACEVGFSKIDVG